MSWDKVQSQVFILYRWLWGIPLSLLWPCSLCAFATVMSVNKIDFSSSHLKLFFSQQRLNDRCFSTRNKKKKKMFRLCILHSAGKTTTSTLHASFSPTIIWVSIFISLRPILRLQKRCFKTRPDTKCIRRFLQPPDDNFMRLTVRDSLPRATLEEFSCGTAERKASPRCHHAALRKYAVGFRRQWVTVASWLNVKIGAGLILSVKCRQTPPCSLLSWDSPQQMMTLCFLCVVHKHTVSHKHIQ